MARLFGFSVTGFLLLALLSGLFEQDLESRAEASIFVRQNIMAWCIVPFDARSRTPDERARMLRNLGITRLAYDWRDEHIPTFDEEIEALKRYGIQLEAFWAPVFTRSPRTEPHLQAIFDLIDRHELEIQLWVMLGEDMLSGLNPKEKLQTAMKLVGYLAEEAGRRNCKVALYNHGGWFGDPKNQIAMIKALQNKNVGIVYNFHHAHHEIAQFEELIRLMEPYLLAVNLNGMSTDGPKILTLGKGEHERELLRILDESGYEGPVGILDHVPERDSEEVLRENLEGLKKLLRELGYTREVKSYIIEPGR